MALPFRRFGRDGITERLTIVRVNDRIENFVQGRRSEGRVATRDPEDLGRPSEGVAIERGQPLGVAKSGQLLCPT